MAHAKSVSEGLCAIHGKSNAAACAQGQLPLRYNDRYLASEATADLYSAAADIVANATLKQAAFDLDQPASTLCKALKQVERHYAQLDWLYWLVTHDEARWIVGLVNSWAGGEFKPRVELTDRERADRLDRALDDVLGHDAAELVRRKAGTK